MLKGRLQQQQQHQHREREILTTISDQSILCKVLTHIQCLPTATVKEEEDKKVPKRSRVDDVIGMQLPWINIVVIVTPIDALCHPPLWSV